MPRERLGMDALSSHELVRSITCDLEHSQDLLCDLRALQRASARRVATRTKDGERQLRQQVNSLNKQLQDEQQARKDLVAENVELRSMLRKTYGQVVDELLQATQALHEKERLLQELQSTHSAPAHNSAEPLHSARSYAALQSPLAPASRPAVRLLKVQMSPAAGADLQQPSPQQQQQQHWPPGRATIDTQGPSSGTGTQGQGLQRAVRAGHSEGGAGHDAAEQWSSNPEGVRCMRPPASGAADPGNPPSLESTPPVNWPPSATPTTPPGTDPWSQLQRATEELSRLYCAQDDDPPAFASLGTQPTQPQPARARQPLFQGDTKPDVMSGQQGGASSAFPFFHGEDELPAASRVRRRPAPPGLRTGAAASILSDGPELTTQVSAAPGYVHHVRLHQGWSQGPGAHAGQEYVKSSGSSSSGMQSSALDSRAAFEAAASSSSGCSSPWEGECLPRHPQHHDDPWARHEGFLPPAFPGNAASRATMVEQQPSSNRHRAAATAGGASVSGSRVPPSRAASAPGASAQGWERPARGAALTGDMVGFMRSTQLAGGTSVPPQHDIHVPEQQEAQHGLEQHFFHDTDEDFSSSELLFKAIKGQLESLQAAFHEELGMGDVGCSTAEPHRPDTQSEDYCRQQHSSSSLHRRSSLHATSHGGDGSDVNIQHNVAQPAIASSSLHHAGSRQARSGPAAAHDGSCIEQGLGQPTPRGFIVAGTGDM